MSKIKHLYEVNNNLEKEYYVPVTTTDAVLNEDGEFLSEILSSITDSIGDIETALTQIIGG